MHCFLQFFSIQYILQIDQTKTKMLFVCLFVSRVFVCLFSIFVRNLSQKKDLPFSFDAFFRDQIYCIDLFLKDKTAYIDVERAKRIIKRIYLPFLLLISSKLYLSAVICIYFSWTFGIKFQIASSPSNLPKQSVHSIVRNDSFRILVFYHVELYGTFEWLDGTLSQRCKLTSMEPFW